MASTAKIPFDIQLPELASSQLNPLNGSEELLGKLPPGTNHQENKQSIHITNESSKASRI